MEPRKWINLLEMENKKEENLTDPRTPLEKHMDAEGGVNPGQPISFSTVYHQNRRLGDNPIKAATNALVVTGVSGYKVSGCPFSQFYSNQGVGRLNHPWHTGIYNNDGSINNEVWLQLSEYAVDTEFDEGSKLIITEQRFYLFLAARRQLETSKDSFAKLASNGEWSGFWQKYGETMPGSLGIKYIPLDKMRLFYEDTRQLNEEVEHRVTHSM